MDPDVVEIAPPALASTSRTRKPRKVNHEVIDVEQYHVDKMNKGKAIQDGHNPFINVANGVMPMDVDDDCTVVPKDIPTGVKVAISTNGSNPFLATPSSTTVQPQTPNVVMGPSPPSRPVNCHASVSSEVVTSPQANFLRDFKRFDTVEDFSDHHYASKGKASKQHSKTWLKKVQADWKILEKDLPETIFVRACESRMDLMRAVIIGAEGTPYHDGLFFFDIHFPDSYPSVPPKVHYHSGGLRINPNLYNCGKVCLSLLGTWTGNKREKWLPQESTMLQLLVSIQALILNQKPYFNEPGYEPTKGTPSGEAHSKVYSENVFLLSLNTMVYSMRKPPKHFEEFVRSHYFVRALDIVKACNAYKDGAPVGSIVKGGVQDIEETSQSGSKKFRTDVAAFMKAVVGEFVKLGVKELQEKPKPPPVVNANTESNTANRKRSRSSSIKEFLANIGRCVFQ
ncbi:ubiquitin-conjugating enzyme E2 26 [Hirschfeldia incana]|nr:ubiquitin-conjugating enzyme E2 26 [Hirschfeldia incana]